jgi:uncharacterized protein Yka (UPF0111/DUF47 family)
VSWLFPNEKVFYDHLTGIAVRLTRVAAMLRQALDDPSGLAAVTADIQRVQHEADVAAHDLDVNIEKLFIPPMDREDIHLLTTGLELVADFIGGTARRITSLRATSRRRAAVMMADLVVKAVGEIEAAVTNIKDSDGVLARCRAIKAVEEEGDAAWEAAVTELFEGSPDAIEVVRWKALYDQLEETLDACDDVANELETITVKHA